MNTSNSTPLLTPHLAPDERLLWCGRPTRWRAASRPMLQLALFALVMLSFVAPVAVDPNRLSRLLEVSGAAARAVNALWIGVAIIAATPCLFHIGRAARTLMGLGQTVYGVTTSRVIIASSAACRSLAPADVANYTRRVSGDSGSLIFKNPAGEFLLFQQPGFFGISDVTGAEKAIRTLLAAEKYLEPQK